ncbi:hypothetical protein [Streptomyces sp. UNOC14_S4]|uniref:hypothetical protein n=1 Tax=Streptomyces sp. UNOC14_S4 TaxID=2872340 RepID=UPI001E48ED83|nr:hypothetical protein [Streptomyces sp. UNOC14_S4]
MNRRSTNTAIRPAVPLAHASVGSGTIVKGDPKTCPECIRLDKWEQQAGQDRTATAWVRKAQDRHFRDAHLEVGDL